MDHSDRADNLKKLKLIKRSEIATTTLFHDITSMSLVANWNPISRTIASKLFDMKDNSMSEIWWS